MLDAAAAGNAVSEFHFLGHPLVESSFWFARQVKHKPHLATWLKTGMPTLRGRFFA